MVHNITTILSYLTVIAQVLILVGAIMVLMARTSTSPVITFFQRHGLFLAWLVAVGAMAASLFYSDVAGFEPCKLCWYQRIAMYPQVLLMGMAWLKKDRSIIPYAKALAVVGLIVALYHNYIYFGGTSILPCAASGLGESCTRRFVFEFGYITIPMMSLTSFVLVVGILSAMKDKKSKI